MKKNNLTGSVQIIQKGGYFNSKQKSPVRFRFLTGLIKICRLFI